MTAPAELSPGTNISVGSLVFYPAEGGVWVVRGPTDVQGSVCAIVQRLSDYFTKSAFDHAVPFDMIVPIHGSDIAESVVAAYLNAAFKVVVPADAVAIATDLARFVAAPTGLLNLRNRTALEYLQFVSSVGYAATLGVQRASVGQPTQVLIAQPGGAAPGEVAAIGNQFAGVISRLAARAESPSLSSLYQHYIAMLAPTVMDDSYSADGMDGAAKKVDEAAMALTRTTKRRIEQLQLEESAAATPAT